MEPLKKYNDFITEGKSTGSSREMMKATDKFHDETLKLQRLQSEFVKTDKEDVKKREILKKKMIEQNRNVPFSVFKRRKN